MRILALLLIGIFAFCAELKIATFNANNLFDGKINGAEYQSFRNGGWNERKYSAKLEKTAKFIKEINADIIALQEIENVGVLKALAQKSDYKYYQFSSLKKSPVGVGFLSKIPIKKAVKIVVPNVKTRPILVASFAFGGEQIRLYNAHFPAYKNGKRARNTAANTMIKYVQNDKNAIILGDLNSRLGYDFLLKNLRGFTNLWDFKTIKKSHISGEVLDHFLLNNNLLNGKILYKKYSFKTHDSGGISDHFALSMILTDEEEKPLPKEQISQIKKITKPTKVSGVVVFETKNGFVIADKTRRGIFVFSPQKFPIGTKLEMAVFKTQIYDENLEISDFDVISAKKNYAQNLEPFMLKQSEFKVAKSGDMIDKIELFVENGIANIDGESVKIFSKSENFAEILGEGKITLQNALVWRYKGQKELIIE